jgi:outer membrane protein OmpA-like peptidoglycan-associated protein
MKTKHMKFAMCLVCMSVLLGCAASNVVSHVDLPRSDHIQQVITATGLKFVDCAISHCPTRTPKSMGSEEQEIPMEVPTASSSHVHFESAAKATEPAQVKSEQLLKSVTVHFKWNSADLGPSEKNSLSELAPFLQVAKRVRVVGRTDGTGAGSANDRLANKRAMNVMLYLRDLVNGAHDTKVELTGKGLCCYVADNETHGGRSMNRRAEVEVYGDVAPLDQHQN